LQALDRLKAGTLDALCDLFGILPRSTTSETVIPLRDLMPDVCGCLYVVRRPDGFRDGIDQGMRCTEIGSCSLQEKQMLRRSVKALIGRRNGYPDGLPQSPCAGFSTPQERQPGLLERSLVQGPTAKRLGDASMRPDETLGDLPGRANERAREQSAHRQVYLPLPSEPAVKVCCGIRAGHNLGCRSRWRQLPSRRRCQPA